jgi:uncharacterized FlaG/YvyC family protein
MSTWDPNLANRFVVLNNVLREVEKAQFTDNRPAVKPVIREPVSPTTEAVRSNTSYTKSYEVLEDPPATVLKFVNQETKQVDAQIPSEVSIRVYKQMIKYMEQIHPEQPPVD